MMPSIVRRHTESMAERPTTFFSTDLFASRPHKSHMRRTATTRTPTSFDPTKWTPMTPKTASTVFEFERAPEDPIYAMLRIRSDPYIAQRRMFRQIALLIVSALILAMVSMTTPPQTESGVLDWVANVHRSMLMLVSAFIFTDTAMVATAVPEYYYRLVMDTSELEREFRRAGGPLPGCTLVVGGVPGGRYNSFVI